MTVNLPKEIAWLGPLPPDYAIVRLGFLVSQVKDKNIGMRSNNLLSLSHGNIKKKDIQSADGLLPESFEGYNCIKKDDIVLRMTDLQNDKRSLRSAISTQDGIITSAYITLHCEKIYPKFLAYYLRCLDNAKVFYSMGSGLRQSLTWDDIRKLPVVVPPMDKQKRIVDELDREFAKIDEFIADQERLQALTEEQYYSQLHQLVTKGVGKSPELIDSNFDWIGSIPSQWTLQKIGWLFNDIGSGTTPSTSDESAFEAGTINWVTTGELRENGISTTKHQINQETLSRYSALKIHPANSILIAMYGATIGRLGWLEEPATTNQAVCVLSNPTNVLPKYAFYALITARQHIFTLASGGGQPNINQDIIRNLKVPVPPIEEQEIIIKKLDITYLQLGNSIRDFALLRKFLDNKKNSIIYSILQTQRTGKK